MLSANGSFTYTPYFGLQPDSFQYQASDGTLLSHTVTVLINPPAAAAHSYNTNMNTSLTVPASTGLLSNDSDPSGYPLLADVVVPPANGSLTLNGDGSFTYVPNAGFTGTDSFTYAANDGVVDSGSQANSTAIDAGFDYAANDGVVASVPATVTITVGVLPTVATPASASPSPVTGTTTSLSVLGADIDTGESEPDLHLGGDDGAQRGHRAGPSGGSNDTNAAKNTTATFSAAGTYGFTVTITDPGDLTATSSVNVTVNQTLTTIAVSPPATSTSTRRPPSSSRPRAIDQFGNALASQPTFTWTTTVASGTINSSSGLFTAPETSATGTVTASSGSLSGISTVNVTDHAPTVATPASASPSTVTGTTTNLAVLGADQRHG